MQVNTQQLIHIGVELVVVGGIAFYLSSQTSNLKRENEELRKDIEMLKALVSRQGQIIESILGGKPISRMQPQKQPQKQSQKQPSQQKKPNYTQEQLDEMLKKEEEENQEDENEEEEEKEEEKVKKEVHKAHRKMKNTNLKTQQTSSKEDGPPPTRLTRRPVRKPVTPKAE